MGEENLAHTMFEAFETCRQQLKRVTPSDDRWLVLRMLEWNLQTEEKRQFQAAQAGQDRNVVPLQPRGV